MTSWNDLQKVFEAYPLRQAAGTVIGYGTSGFRTVGNLIAPLAARIAPLLVLRSLAAGGSDLGVVITASHNPPVDNGLKIVDCEGGMLEMSWEPLAVEIANASTWEAFLKAIATIEKRAGKRILSDGSEGQAVATASDIQKLRFHIGRDTRPTGNEIRDALASALSALGATVVDHGIVSTPMLHAVVWFSHEGRRNFGVPDYYAQIVKSVKDLFSVIEDLRFPTGRRTYRRQVVVDCANGVGSLPLMKLSELFKEANVPLDFILLNTKTDHPECLNEQCGADLLQKSRNISPELAAEWAKVKQANPGCPVSVFSIDGDADRVVSFAARQASDSKVEADLLDGDRLSVLYARMIQELLAQLQMGCRVGVVQTAYANGASTHYLRDQLGLETFITATGVKHLHHKATELDIGIYFEANGHGTVLFNEMRFLSKVKQVAQQEAAGAADDSASPSSASPAMPTPGSPHPGGQRLNRGVAAKILLLFANLLSQSCGDAVGDLIAAEIALEFMDWTPQDWLSCFDDLPSIQSKVKVPNPMIIQTIENQTRTTAPAGLQEDIDELVEKFGGAEKKCRAFVRPSGTEPIVRVYAESTSAATTESLAEQVARAVTVRLYPSCC
jgi:phosphoacetylglucosamine mutase